MVKARVNVEVLKNDTKKVFDKAYKKIMKTGEVVVRDVAYLGRNYARSIAPKGETGKTASLIKVFRGQGGDGPKARIVAQNPTADDGHKRNIQNFNLVRWMHTSPRAKAHIKTGDELFMYSTRDLLNEKKKGIAKGRFNNINLR